MEQSNDLQLKPASNAPMRTNFKHLFSCLKGQTYPSQNVAFAFVSQEDIHAEKIHLLKRFSQSKVVDGTHKLHSSCIRGCSTKLLVKEYARAQTSKIVSVSYRVENSSIKWEEINVYVTCFYNGRWWLASVLEKMEESDEVKVSFLYPHRPARSFSYPGRKNELIILPSVVLTVVNPRTATGRTYSLADDETKKSTDALSNHVKLHNFLS